MKIYNYTGRTLNIYDREDTIIRNNRLYLRSSFCSPAEVIASCCDLNNLPGVYSVVEPMSFGALTVPTQQFVDAQRIEDFCPDFNYKEDMLVVPNIWAQVVRNLSLIPEYTLLASVYNLIRDNSGKTIGCLGLELK